LSLTLEQHTKTLLHEINALQSSNSVLAQDQLNFMKSFGDDLVELRNYTEKICSSVERISKDQEEIFHQIDHIAIQCLSGNHQSLQHDSDHTSLVDAIRNMSEDIMQHISTIDEKAGRSTKDIIEGVCDIIKGESARCSELSNFALASLEKSINGLATSQMDSAERTKDVLYLVQEVASTLTGMSFEINLIRDSLFEIPTRIRSDLSAHLALSNTELLDKIKHIDQVIETRLDDIVGLSIDTMHECVESFKTDLSGWLSVAISESAGLVKDPQMDIWVAESRAQSKLIVTCLDRLNKLDEALKESPDSNGLMSIRDDVITALQGIGSDVQDILKKVDDMDPSVLQREVEKLRSDSSSSASALLSELQPYLQNKFDSLQSTLTESSLLRSAAVIQGMVGAVKDVIGENQHDIVKLLMNHQKILQSSLREIQQHSTDTVLSHNLMSEKLSVIMPFLEQSKLDVCDLMRSQLSNRELHVENMINGLNKSICTRLEKTTRQVEDLSESLIMQDQKTNIVELLKQCQSISSSMNNNTVEQDLDSLKEKM
jgi:hypothetical protein